MNMQKYWTIFHLTKNHTWRVYILLQHYIIHYPNFNLLENTTHETNNSRHWFTFSSSLLIQPGQSPSLQHAGWVLGYPLIWISGMKQLWKWQAVKNSASISEARKRLADYPLQYRGGQPNTPMSVRQRERFHSICKQVSSLYGFPCAVTGLIKLELYCMKCIGCPTKSISYAIPSMNDIRRLALLYQPLLFLQELADEYARLFSPL